MIAKWSIFFGLLFLFFGFIILGRWHAMKRINKGLRPMAYHRVRDFQHHSRVMANKTQWLLNRRQKALYDPSYRQPQVFYAAHPPAQYNMYAMPPPVYDPNSAPPPGYQPPPGGPGGHKIDPSQARPMEGEASPSYVEAPPAARTHNTGASNNPFRG